MNARNAVTVVVTLVVTLLVLNLSLGNKQVDARLSHAYSVADPQFLRAISGMLSPALSGGDHSEELLKGDQIFAAMLGAIRGAERTITFETYIFWSGTIGAEFADALSARARDGVRVHVMLDWIGGDVSDKLLKHARERS